jgi:uncharacterized protein YjbI with pentapeptide repeats
MNETDVLIPLSSPSGIVAEMVEGKDTHSVEQQTKPLRWRPTKRQVLWAICLVVALVTITVLVANLYPAIWQDLSRERVAMLTGIGVALAVVIVLLAIGGASLGWTGFADKTLWEWLQLLGALAIPIVLAIAGFWFTAQQEVRQERIEKQRADAERELEEQRAQDAALQAYLDEMSSLMIGQNSLRASEEDSEVRTLAQARTVTVLGGLDSNHKTQVMQFLLEADLVGSVDESGPIIGLRRADLRGTNLFNANLRGANLHFANLSRAVLGLADLSNADLVSAELNHTDLRGADLSKADLILADLICADLSDANLTSVDLSYADLTNADLSGAYKIPKDSLERRIFPSEELKQETKSLKGATMPDGQKYEDGLKDKQGCGEDEGNSGPS